MDVPSSPILSIPAGVGAVRLASGDVVATGVMIDTGEMQGCWSAAVVATLAAARRFGGLRARSVTILAKFVTERVTRRKTPSELQKHVAGYTLFSPSVSID